MKISELLETRIPKKFFMPNAKEASQLPSAPSLNDEPSAVDGPGDAEVDDSEENTVDENAVSQFKSAASSLGSGLFVLSPWDYPAAWSGETADDGRMHSAVVLAGDLGFDISSIENLSDQAVADGRRIDAVFLNGQTDTMFTLQASGASGDVQWTPSLSDLQTSGGVTNPQLTKLKKIEAALVAWTDAVPSGFEGERATGAWKRAEVAVLKALSLLNVGGSVPDGGANDPAHPDFWRSGVTANAKGTPERQARAKANSDKWIADFMAKKKGQ